MKLIARAKPVRIRITSGGEEHATLNSLRKNFIWNDIKELFDGRLIKWLKRIDENEKAQVLSEINNPDENILFIFNILFSDSVQFQNLEDVLLSFENDSSLLELSKELIRQESIEKIVSFLFDDRLKRSADILIPYIKSYVSDFPNQIGPKMLFDIGKKFFNIEDSKNVGRKFIEQAAKEGYYEARKFITQNTSFFRIGYDEITDILSLESTKNIIRTSWGNNRRIPLNSYPSPLKEILEFSNICLNISNIGTNYCWADVERMVIIHFVKIPQNDILYEEKQFMAALFLTVDKEKQGRILRNLKDYGPAQKLLKSGTITINGGVFSIDSFYKNINNLERYIFNLDQFRYERSV